MQELVFPLKPVVWLVMQRDFDCNQYGRKLFLFLKLHFSDRKKVIPFPQNNKVHIHTHTHTHADRDVFSPQTHIEKESFGLIVYLTSEACFSIIYLHHIYIYMHIYTNTYTSKHCTRHRHTHTHTLHRHIYIIWTSSYIH